MTRTLVETYELIAQVHQRTAQVIAEHAEKLERKAEAARAELVQQLRAQGMSGEEIEDGLELLDQALDKIAERAIAELFEKPEAKH